MQQTDNTVLTGPDNEGYAQSCGLYWQAYGNAADPVLLMIRGLGSQLIHWPENLLQRIAGEGYRVVVFDNRDSGLSDKHQALTGNTLAQRLQQAWRGETVTPVYTLTDMATDVARLMDELEIPEAHILGGSMGGLIAQIFAAYWPERTLSLSVVFSTSLDPQLPKGHGWNLLYDDNQAPVAEPLSLPDDPEIFADMVRASAAESALYTGTDHRPTDEQQLQLADQALRRCYCPEGYMRQLLAILCHGDLREANRSIAAPTLILHGAADPIFPVACAQSIADSIDGARLEVLDGWGHDLPDSMHDWFISRLTGLLRVSETDVACSAG